MAAVLAELSSPTVVVAGDDVAGDDEADDGRPEPGEGISSAEPSVESALWAASHSSLLRTGVDGAVGLVSEKLRRERRVDRKRGGSAAGTRSWSWGTGMPSPSMVSTTAASAATAAAIASSLELGAAAAMSWLSEVADRALEPCSCLALFTQSFHSRSARAASSSLLAAPSSRPAFALVHSSTNDRLSLHPLQVLLLFVLPALELIQLHHEIVTSFPPLCQLCVLHFPLRPTRC
jgi:hypothetical protein